MWVVHVGLTEQPTHGAQSLAVEQIIYHTGYESGEDYDVALMKLATTLPFNGIDFYFHCLLNTYLVLNSILFFVHTHKCIPAILHTQK